MQNNPQPNILSSMLLKETSCHSEAGLEIISRDHYIVPLPQDRINIVTIISDRSLQSFY